MTHRNVLRLVLIPKVVPKNRDQKKAYEKEMKRLKDQLSPALCKCVEVAEGDEPAEYKEKFMSEMKVHFIMAAEQLNKTTTYFEINTWAFGNIFDKKEDRFENN